VFAPSLIARELEVQAHRSLQNIFNHVEQSRVVIKTCVSRATMLLKSELLECIYIITMRKDRKQANILEVRNELFGDYISNAVPRSTLSIGFEIRVVKTTLPEKV